MFANAKIKPCKYCGSKSHISFQCAKRHKPLNRIGKVGKMWLHTRKSWITQNPGPWKCYLCGIRLELQDLTLDHIKSRSRHPNLRYNEDNLAPCCYSCNEAKGSRSAEEYLKELHD